MRRKWFSLALFAGVIVLLITLCGSLFNTRFPLVENGASLSGVSLEDGVALSGWTEISPQNWQFSFTDAPSEQSLILCIAGRSKDAPPTNLQSLEGRDEFFLLSSSDSVLTVTASSAPSTWLMTTDTAWRWINLRSDLQLIALVAFVSMGAGILALFCFKPQRELGCFLLYIAVMFFWGLTIYLNPTTSTPLQYVIARFYFPFAVAVPLWLCIALTHSFPPLRLPHKIGVVLLLSLFIYLTTFTNRYLCNLTLAFGMLLVVLFLALQLAKGSNSAWYLMVGYLPTTGLRMLVLLLPLGLFHLTESFPFYMIRCARIYDIPFALGCLVYVCRRFALQFDRAEQLTVELEQRVAQRTQALQEESDARKSMMLNIFHDLRSPLFVVRNGLETMEAAPESVSSLLPVLQQRVAFIQELTEDLFLAAKLEQKQILLNEDRVLLADVVHNICSACEAEAQKKDIDVTVSILAPLPVWGDTMRLEQIIQNLITNAIHYTPAGGNITVKALQNEQFALVQVSDTGCGIAPEDQAAVFDRYFHTTANSKHDSTGLGLTIAQELAHLHHGEITLQSEVGKGSTFTLQLPLLAMT